jgi:hypothetical protein
MLGMLLVEVQFFLMLKIAPRWLIALKKMKA